VGTIDDRLALDADDCDGTRTVATVIGGLEVDRRKRWYM
jgi:hypothetical protein